MLVLVLHETAKAKGGVVLASRNVTLKRYDYLTVLGQFTHIITNEKRLSVRSEGVGSVTRYMRYMPKRNPW